MATYHVRTETENVQKLRKNSTQVIKASVTGYRLDVFQ